MGCTLRSSPRATLPKVTWASPSPMRERRLQHEENPEDRAEKRNERARYQGPYDEGVLKEARRTFHDETFAPYSASCL